MSAKAKAARRPLPESLTFDCDYCGEHVTVSMADLHASTNRDTLFLCVPCMRAGHTDEEVIAADAARHAAKEAAAPAVGAPMRCCVLCEVRTDLHPCCWCGFPACAAHRVNEYGLIGCTACTAPAPPRTPRETAPVEAVTKKLYIPEPFSRQVAIDAVIRYWNQEEIDDRQAENLCARIHAGQFDEQPVFNRAIRCARLRHEARYHRPLGPSDPRHNHRSGLSHNNLWLAAPELRDLIRNLEQTLAMMPDPSWKPEEHPDYIWDVDVRLSADGERILVPGYYVARYAFLKRRYRWMTGRDYTPYTIETAQLEKEAS